MKYILMCMCMLTLSISSFVRAEEQDEIMLLQMTIEEVAEKYVSFNVTAEDVAIALVDKETEFIVNFEVIIDNILESKLPRERKIQLLMNLEDSLKSEEIRGRVLYDKRKDELVQGAAVVGMVIGLLSPIIYDFVTPAVSGYSGDYIGDAIMAPFRALGYLVTMAAGGFFGFTGAGFATDFGLKIYFKMKPGMSEPVVDIEKVEKYVGGACKLLLAKY